MEYVPGLFARRNEFPQPDFTIYWRADDGREISIGRIFLRDRTSGPLTPPHPWFWSIEFHQRRGRPEPHQGSAPDQAQAFDAFKRAWESAAIAVR